MSNDNYRPNALPFEFSGSGSEYFRIWIVNCVFTVLTLGIYSAWAKVRRLQYFYQNTSLDGAAFDYHGNPKLILRGRIIGFGLLMGYNLAFEFSFLIGAAIGLILILGMPWFVRQALRFRLHNSSYRGLRFHFSGSTPSAYRALLMPLLLLAALGWGVFYYARESPALLMLMPFFLLALYFMLGAKIHFQLKNFQHANSRFGQSQFRFAAKQGDFTRVYGKVLGVGMIVALLTLWLIPAPDFSGKVDSRTEETQTRQPPEAPTCTARESDPEDHACADEPTTELTPTQDAREAVRWILPVAPLVGILIAYLVISAPYLNTRIHNLVWNHTELEQHKIISTLKARRLYWIHFTNWLGILFTIGLYKPFAEIRLYRYKISCLSVLPHEDFESFLGEKTGEVTAAGEEIAEAFDYDLGF